jgi:hypothetical protein
MTALTTSMVNKLNKMNRAAKDATLGTRIAADEVIITSLSAGAVVSGSYTAVTADASASAITAQTSLASIKRVFAQTTRSGSVMADTNVAISGSKVVVTSASATYVVTVGDVVNYVVS